MYRAAILASAFLGLFGLTSAVAEEAEIITTYDVPYGAHERQKLDIYSPVHVRTGAPIVVFFHGGAWRYGDKADAADAGKSFASRGVIFVSANYRLFPSAVFPEFIEDAAAVVALTLDTLQPAGGESHPLFLSGWSAGAYNAALLTYDQQFLARHGIGGGTVKGLIGLSGPYEGGLCAGARCEQIFPERLRGEWKVADHVERTEPPALLIVAESDRYVPERHHRDLVDAIRRVGSKVTVHVMPSDSHTATLNALGDDDSPVRGLIEQFIAAPTPVSLESCPPLPVSADGLGLTLLISDDGNVVECAINHNSRCGRIFDSREGFLCISVDPDARPTLTQIEGPNSQRVDRVIIDGVEYDEGAVGYPHLHLRDVIAAGPSGSTYEIAVQTTVGGKTFITTLTVTADLERPAVTFSEISISHGGILN